ncbi:hypothetical protein E0493_22755 [Roseomonas sp. M0104]|uniref:VIT domain-containing protein n=1 Tax=Teichococcus coralli TaxID=2545983 RepID=A0A845BLY7_9PROT|nr:VIT domain-containing protein [Pseudoroseomonas coralli]MXP66152.1 hypothetical protein [Pseudoroseomonas coralli]
MPPEPLPALADPLAAYAQPAINRQTRQPVPLTGTAITVRIAGGLAIVATERCLHNAEAASLEVTLTLPVPVHATLLRLAVRIGERVLTGRAQRRDQARATYEDALDRGQTAVLHEEVLRGVHMLSVGHVPPGESVVVTSTWAMPLALADRTGRVTLLRIPTTVGDVYGRSPLADSDDLRHGGPVQEVDLTVRCDQGQVALAGHPLVDGRARLRLDAPIDLRITGWSATPLHGRAADGRSVRLEITVPDHDAPEALDAAVLVDHSGSMADTASSQPARSGRGGLSKHAVLVQGLRAAAAALRDGDRLDLWEFDDDAEPVEAESFRAAVARLSGPRGGTEIGAALAQVLQARATRDVLLVTDGKSHALEVQALARRGRRVQVVLIGEDSLEAQVGHLAALTGGQIFIASGEASGEAVRLAVRAMRQPHLTAPASEGAPTQLETVLGGLHLAVRWSEAEGAAEMPDPELSRAVAAVAAALALPRLDHDAAAALAEAEGIVGHLTSLVLVDAAGAAQEGIPAQRQLAGMTPATAALPMLEAAMDLPPPVRALLRAAPPRPSRRTRPQPAGTPPTASMAPPNPEEAGPRSPVGDLHRVGRVLDWSADPEALRRGELAALPPVLQAAVRQASQFAAVLTLAQALGTPPEVIVLALIAGLEAGTNRGAQRFARAVLGKAEPAAVAGARGVLGL